MRNHPQFGAYLALILLCFFWGTTYLGIRIALDSMGPMTLVCLRNLVAGSLTLIAGKIIGAKFPRGRELWMTAGLGLMTLGMGNGTLSVAEQWIPTGIASLFQTTSPFWYAGADALVPGGERLHWPTLRGMLLGTVGVLLLFVPSLFDSASQTTAAASLWAGFLLLQAAQGTWSFAAILQRRMTQTAHPIISGAVQQMATGIVFLIPAALERYHPFTARGVGAMLYLAIFGGIVGYSCFLLVMNRLPVMVATVYLYVNPIVAVALGWLVYREHFGSWEAAGMAVIFLGVAMVRRAAAPVQQLGPQSSTGRR